ncbi:DedA family protein [Hyalangium versicolor]|uniref:DedA family protein n=1 Tax=Hyalangium versicolor TaxID=2861190 RepID=UPI001CCFCDC9|nr:DedA family protein [Hyalangium versicolor]
MGHGLLGFLLTHGSYALLFAALVAGGMGLPLPEDIVLLTGGALAHLGVVQLPLVIAVCMAGVLCGDLLLFHTARKLGPRVYEQRWIRAMLTPERRLRIARLYERHGGKVVFFGRYMSVMRVLVFAMAATQGMRTRTFLLWDALALSFSAPLLVGLGYVFARSIDRVAAGFGHVEHVLAIVVVSAFALALVVRTLKVRRQRA